MKLHSLSLILLTWSTLHTANGQIQPETNNKKHYNNLTAGKEITRLYQKLKAGYTFDKLAQEYSQDYGSYEVGGRLGWQKQNQFVAAFRDVVGIMSNGQVSKPFKTEFGYHIVQFLDKRQGEILTRHILIRVNH